MSWEIPLFFLGLVIGVGGVIFANWVINKRVVSVVNARNSVKGVEAKAENKNRLMAFLLDLKQTHTDWKTAGGTDLKDFGLKHVPAVLLKYPDVVVTQGKSLMKLMEGGGFGGLEDFL
jgi:hypothetical protein